MLKKRILTGGFAAALFLTSGISVALADSLVIAGTTYQSFDLKVPGNNVNNSEGETGSQTKATSGADAGLQIDSTGGSSLDVRTESSDGNGDWKYGVTSSNTYALDSPQLKGKSVHLQFSTGIFQGPVTITGKWRSN